MQNIDTGRNLHPSKTARVGNVPDNAITRGVNADFGPFPASKEVWCRQCGFRCNLARDARGVNEFAGETITSGNELSNGSFEDWTAGDPDDWTLSGSVTQETTAGFFDWRDGGVSSAKITRSGSDIVLSQVMATPSDFNSNLIRFGARVKSVTNGVIRLRADVNSVVYTSHYNVAQQRFQDIALVVQCPATVSSLTVYIRADSQDGTAYVDSSILLRDGAPTTGSIVAGCPHCGSYDYF